MTRLKHLHLGELHLPADPAAPSRVAFLPCLAALSSLTYLAAEGRRVVPAFAKFAAEGQLQAAWPALRLLCLAGVFSFHHNASACEVKTLVAAACAHPGLRKLLLGVDDDSSTIFTFSRDEHARAAQLRMDLMRAAARGSVALHFHARGASTEELVWVR